METGLLNKVALVTGASGAIGRAAACAVGLDHGDLAAVQGVVEQITTRLGPISVLVANAVQWPAFDADEIGSLTTSLAVNTVGPVALIDAALPAMRAAGWGRVVAVSTDIVEQPMAGPLAYATAKGALETAARVLAVREARHGILTNIVRPGFTLTERALNAPFLGPEAVAAESEKTGRPRTCALTRPYGSQEPSRIAGDLLTSSPPARPDHPVDAGGVIGQHCCL